jgi:hypothetical protein
LNKILMNNQYTHFHKILLNDQCTHGHMILLKTNALMATWFCWTVRRVRIRKSKDRERNGKKRTKGQTTTYKVYT